MQAGAHRNRGPWPTVEGLHELQHLVGHQGRFRAAFVCGRASLSYKRQLEHLLSARVKAASAAEVGDSSKSFTGCRNQRLVPLRETRLLDAVAGFLAARGGCAGADLLLRETLRASTVAPSRKPRRMACTGTLFWETMRHSLAQSRPACSWHKRHHPQKQERTSVNFPARS
jgi:hypothetical protein